MGERVDSKLSGTCKVRICGFIQAVSLSHTKRTGGTMWGKTLAGRRSDLSASTAERPEMTGACVPSPNALIGCLLAVGLTAVLPTTVLEAQEPEGFRNLHVLPTDVERRVLIDVMLENQQGLGLPRRANEGCLFCHVGSLDIPSGEWDWASDENPRKVTARAMMEMVEEINGTYLAGIDRTSELEVTCYTCHAGRTNPLPLEAVLQESYEEGGIDALIDRYRTLRTRYFAADAYDFRTSTLISVADRMFDAGHVADALRVHETNIASSEEPSAHQGLIRMRMMDALASNGVEAMVNIYHELKQSHPAEAYQPGLLSSISWRLFRAGSEEAGVRLWELNFEEHPESYVATEDLAWGRESTGDHDGAIALAEAWATLHPEHELGLRLLADLRESGGLR